MQLHTNTPPDRLVLRHHPPWLFFLLLLVIAVICGGAAAVRALSAGAAGQAVPMLMGLSGALVLIWMFVRPVQLVADATRGGTVEIRQLTPRGRSHLQLPPLAQIDKAGVQGHTELRHGPRQIWLALYLEQGDQMGWQAITAPPSRLGGEARAAQYFNAWLKSHRAREKLRG